jgi:DNA repair ATPase RecN
MPASEPRDPSGLAADPAAVMQALEKAVIRLLDGYETLRERADTAEAAYAKLSEALKQSEFDPLDTRDVEGRVQNLAEENARLKLVIDEARERAERIRGRLIMVEDEL